MIRGKHGEVVEETEKILEVLATEHWKEFSREDLYLNSEQEPELRSP